MSSCHFSIRMIVFVVLLASVLTHKQTDVYFGYSDKCSLTSLFYVQLVQYLIAIAAKQSPGILEITLLYMTNC